jgi:DNA-binding response OmpR family regulator
MASVLLVDRDASCGRALAVVLRRQGHRVQLARTRTKALALARRQAFDLAIVDLFVDGGGVELARDLSRHVPRLLLTVGMGMKQEEVLEAALGFPLHRKSVLPSVLAPRVVTPVRARGGASSDKASAATLPGFPPLSLDASEPSPAPRSRAHGRGRSPH